MVSQYRIPSHISNRLIIENVSPEINGGRYPVKRVVGDDLEVSADIFRDGHDRCGAALLIRRETDVAWHSIPMRLVDNDRWVGVARCEENTRFLYSIEAWTDLFGSWRARAAIKRAVGQDIALEWREGRGLIEIAAASAPYEPRCHLHALLAPAEDETAILARLDQMLAPEIEASMALWGPRTDVTRLDRILDLVVDRPAARFAAWYEMVPRSQGTDPTRGATFAEATARLDDIQRMGFDTIYLVPIHPIGTTNRKGRNNALAAAPGEPGSPYAIGSSDGGHDAIHPQLGTLDDFRAFVAACQARQMEVALDFAVQCSPDHPWVAEHPEWFEFRPDGSIRFAENPPKKYQDIVNMNFGSPEWESLWHALRDVVLFWIHQGVRVFRVDNPHTKPFPFWEWLIRGVQSAHPDVLFLAEAFTRPKPMRLLAKAGFTQSYSYFTWRNEKQELIEYFTELTQGEARDYYRPNLFANTPDILPTFLQEGGTPAFRIRAVLAATLGGLYGIYNGFELCENRALPNSEEYADSEKYEYKVWDWDRPGNIKPLITQLNRIRRENTAFADGLNLVFLPCDNDRILFYGRLDQARENFVFIAVSLDPTAAQSGTVEFPHQPLGLADYRDFTAENLLNGDRRRWVGYRQTVRLTPEEPASILRIAKLPQRESLGR